MAKESNVPAAKKEAPDSKAKKEKKKAKFEGKKKEVKDKNLRFIVRIAGKDLDGTKPINVALTKIKGVGIRYATVVAKVFEEEEKIPYNALLGKLEEARDIKLEDIVVNPLTHGIPEFMLNRKRDVEDGKSRQLLMADLDLQRRNDIQKLGRIKSYRGLRHAWGLPVRGQRTRSTHKRGLGTVGVVKKQVTKAGAEASSSSKGE